MQKDEILKKVQSKNPQVPDEREIQVAQKGNEMGILFIFTISLMLLIIKIIGNKPWYDIVTITLVCKAAQNLYKAIKLHKILDWVLGIANGILAILFLIRFITTTLG